MRIISIPPEKYEDYRTEVIFNGYKWDPQFQDTNTVAKHALIISEQERIVLEDFAVQLYIETINAERAINNNLRLAKTLLIPKQIRKIIKNLKSYQAEKHIRLVRYDFHPLGDNKWAVSEVNSDVPGGFAEASVMPKIALNTLNISGYRYIDFSEKLVLAIVEKVLAGGKIMLVHCTSYSDDRQCMQFIGDKLKDLGFYIIYAAADHLRFENNKAFSILYGNTEHIDAILRFTPIEWLIGLKPKKYWYGYFETITPSCNHPIAVFTQTKRFPLIWDELEKEGIDLSTWRKLLPETLEVKNAKNKEEYIYKPANGRVGEGISIKEACRENEYRKILKDVKRHPNKYIAQKRFISTPIISDDGIPFHICVGVYCVEGNAAGFYARISKTPRIDSSASDIPVLIERTKV